MTRTKQPKQPSKRPPKHKLGDDVNGFVPPPKRSRSHNTMPAAAPARPISHTECLAEKSLFRDEPDADQCRREDELYDLLDSDQDSEQLAAAQTLMAKLFGGEGVSGGILVEHFDKIMMRGLAGAAKKASRVGLSLVLTEILDQLYGERNLAGPGQKYSGLTFEKMLVAIAEKTRTKATVDASFGQAFGIECLVRARVLFREKSRWTPVLDLLVELMKTRPWARPLCGLIVAHAMAQMEQKAAEKTLQRLADEDMAMTPEGVAVWITALDLFSGIKVPKTTWKDPLASAVSAKLLGVLKDDGRALQKTHGQKQKKNQKLGTRPVELHFVWNVILSHHIKLAETSERHAADQLSRFWARIVDDGFFSKDTHGSHKATGLLVFRAYLEGTAGYPCMVESLFSKNLMACLMEKATGEGRPPLGFVRKTLLILEAVVKCRPSLVGVVLPQLLSNNGDYNFDDRTQGSSVKILLQSTTAAHVDAVLEALEKPLADDKTWPKSISALGGYLVKLSTRRKDDPEAAVSGPALKRLMKLAISDPSIPDAQRRSLLSRLPNAFRRFIQTPQDFQYLCSAILETENGYATGNEFTDQTLKQAFGRLGELVGEKKAKKPNKSKEAATTTAKTNAQRQAVAMLYATLILQLYKEDPDAMDLFQELEACYEKLLDKAAKSETGTAEFLIEILLALVTRPSLLLRQISHQVFEVFTSLVSPGSLELLAGPLDADESGKGHKELFATDDNMDGMLEGTGESDVEIQSDVDIVNHEEGAVDDEGELVAFNKALAQALKVKSKNVVLNSDGDDSDSEESDMTDSEMMAIDETLVEMFKKRTKQSVKGKKQEARDSVVHFKGRVLELLGIFVKKEAAAMNPLAFEALFPLLRLARRNTANHLRTKALDIVANLGRSAGNKKKAIAPNDDEPPPKPDAFFPLLQRLHEGPLIDSPGSCPPALFFKAVSDASAAIASAICRVGADEADHFERLCSQYGASYAKTQLAKLTRGRRKDGKWDRHDSVRSARDQFFADWQRWCLVPVCVRNGN